MVEKQKQCTSLLQPAQQTSDSTFQNRSSKNSHYQKDFKIKSLQKIQIQPSGQNNSPLSESGSPQINKSIMIKVQDQKNSSKNTPKDQINQNEFTLTNNEEENALSMNKRIMKTEEIEIQEEDDVDQDFVSKFPNAYRPQLMSEKLKKYQQDKNKHFLQIQHRRQNIRSDQHILDLRKEHWNENEVKNLIKLHYDVKSMKYLDKINSEKRLLPIQTIKFNQVQTHSQQNLRKFQMTVKESCFNNKKLKGKYLNDNLKKQKIQNNSQVSFPNGIINIKTDQTVQDSNDLLNEKDEYKINFNEMFADDDIQTEKNQQLLTGLITRKSDYAANTSFQSLDFYSSIGYPKDQKIAKGNSKSSTKDNFLHP